MPFDALGTDTSIRAQAPGYFVFSLDTELAWGYFDHDRARERLFSPDGSRERASIRRLLALCDQYQVRATWAVVGHLFHPRCEPCAQCPLMEWRGRHGSFDAIYQSAHPLWYAADVIDLLAARGHRHEIAFHGYSHRPFDALDQDQARDELARWKAAAARHGLVPASVVFPRNLIAHLPVLAAGGCTSFRADTSPFPYGRRSRWGALVKVLAQITGIPAPTTFRLAELPVRDGLVEQPPSAYLFDLSRSLEGLLDALGLATLRLTGILRAIDQAAAQSRIMHLWAHPWELRTEKDFIKVERVFARVAEQVAAGRLLSVTMSEITQLRLGAPAASRMAATGKLAPARP